MAQKPAEAASDLQRRLVGTWRLVHHEYERPDGSVRPDTAPSIGRLIYDPGGRMSVQIQGVRPGDAPADHPTYIAYFGNYEVHEPEGFIVHKVQTSLQPGRDGTNQQRFFRLEGDRLTLRTPPQPNGEIAILVWQREG
ncbi:MAG TPA: lipocalin-like domain-containing protein [Dehalococcoidia bacterium]|nr:lipocalin-like domain-containing protein [Dehalococcoidia bacterium]